jgi:exportin-T
MPLPLTLNDQIVSAIQIAFDHTAAQTYKREAFDYVNELRQQPTAWQPCLSIFTQEPRQPEVVRIFCLDIVNNAIQSGQVDHQNLKLVKEQILSYVQRTYAPSDAIASLDRPSLENKVAQTITYLFSAFYTNGWETCIDDLLALTDGPSGTRTNVKGVSFYLRVINSIHDEIGDTLLSRSRPEQDKANVLKDLIRERDVGKIATSWHDILSQYRASSDLVAELCLKAIGKWVSWIDISLIVNQSMLELLFQQLERAQQVNLAEPAEKARDAAVDVFTETVSKKMQPSDKMSLVSFLNLNVVVSQLIACPPLNDSRGSSIYDVDLAETVAKLVNAVVVDLVRILETDNVDPATWSKAESSLTLFLPHLLRFFSDEYDEVCSTVLTAMTEMLGFLRKTSQEGGPQPRRAVMLLPILKAIFAKMRYDETASWGDDEDKTDEAEFQELRKRLAALQQTIAAADEPLYVDAITGLVHDTFSKLRISGSQVNWRDLDLALYEVYQMGDLAVKSGGLYQKNKPNSPTAEKLVRMMLEMVESNTGSFGHPAIQLQYMEICVRYSSFFEYHTQFIEGVLQNFIQLAHHQNLKVRSRSWYLLHRFIRSLRSYVGHAAEAVVQNLADLLVIKAELPDEDDDDMSSDGDSTAEARFTSQLYLFEAIGCIAGATSVPVNKQAELVRRVMQPLFLDIEHNLDAAKSGLEQPALQVHHDIMALSTVARGYSDFMPGGTSTHATEPPAEAKQSFAQVAEAVLAALESLKSSFQIRTAARFAFARLVGMAGPPMIQQLPRWVSGLLTDSSSKDEMALFLRLLDQVIFAFKGEISTLLDQMFTSLLQRVFAGISTQTSGTDDEIELAELKREYLNFLLIILANDLESVLVSTANQSMFDTIVGTLDHFAKDIEDYPTARMSFMVMAKMCSVWGGPDIAAPTQPNGPSAPQPAMAGFDQFMMTRFSPLCWALPTNANFNNKDGQARQALNEAGALQKTIYHKLGDQYLTWLRDNELRGMGMADAMMNEYLQKLSTMDMRAFKSFFAKFVAQGGQI